MINSPAPHGTAKRRGTVPAPVKFLSVPLSRRDGEESANRVPGTLHEPSMTRAALSARTRSRRAPRRQCANACELSRKRRSPRGMYLGAPLTVPRCEVRSEEEMAPHRERLANLSLRLFAGHAAENRTVQPRANACDFLALRTAAPDGSLRSHRPGADGAARNLGLGPPAVVGCSRTLMRHASLEATSGEAAVTARPDVRFRRISGATFGWRFGSSRPSRRAP